MPRACSVCSHPESSEINRASTRGESERAVAKRFGLTQASVNRHRNRCLGISATKRTSAKPREEVSSPETTRITPELSGEMSRAQRFAAAIRLLNEALDLLEQSKRDGDRATALKALREARDSLALVMRAEGDLADATSGPNIDNRSINVFADWRPDELRELIRRTAPIEGGVLPVGGEPKTALS